MPSITVKSIPQELYEHLRQSAAANRRSINSEIIVCVERTLRNRRTEPKAIIAASRRLREKTRKHPITDAVLASGRGGRFTR